MPFKPMKVLIADGSGLFCGALKKAMSGDAGIGAVKTAVTSAEAAGVLKSFAPDVIVAGPAPQGGGASDLIESLISSHAAPVVAVGSSSADGERLLRAGAADFILMPEKPQGKSMDAFCAEVCVRVKIAAVPHTVRAAEKPPARTSKTPASNPYRVVAIGASTGGTDATAEIVKRLPGGLPGILIVQHMPPGFTKMYAERLDGISDIRVSEARDGDRVERGTALVAAGGRHLMLRKDAEGYYVRCAEGDRVNGHCPSVGVLFDSVAKAAGPEAIGVILTGMGKDGAEGLLHMRKAGAFTIGQDRATSVVYGMPMAAKELGAVERQEPIQKIADLILEILQK